MDVTNVMKNKLTQNSKLKESKIEFLKKQWSKNKYLYIMLIPVIAFYVVFCYVPMYGLVLAFQSSYNPSKGMLAGHWIGFEHFTTFFKSFFFVRLMGNTILLSLLSLLIGFPAPIILALLLNELRGKAYKSIVQTISYLPHFISVVVVAGMIINFTSQNGLINHITALFGKEPTLFMNISAWFRPIYITSNVWQGVGWGSIIYLAALSGVDTQIYEAAKIDGAGRWKQLWNVTIPGIMPTIIIMLILKMGGIMNADWQKIVLIYNAGIYETSDIIQTFVYRQGILGGDFSYSTAINLFLNVINLFFLLAANTFSKKFNESSLW